MNALKHGLSAQTIVVNGENAEELEELYKRFEKAIVPVDPMEDELVWKITMAAWRLRRMHRIEAHLFRGTPNSKESSRMAVKISQSMTAHEATAAYLALVQSPRTSKVAEVAEPVEKIITKAADEVGVGFTNMCDSSGPDVGFHALNHLLRYEVAAERAFYQALHALERWQAKRRGEDVPVPRVANVRLDVAS
jgi:hypothetical protein